ncbi:hypothetical protein AMECASPLE_027555 [Ameca splendens]|uniref:Uncharacterized protein n=1 Tax=Ameca splendens TaxID=208324 RepID=A0ABV0YTF2_9TELE
MFKGCHSTLSSKYKFTHLPITSSSTHSCTPFSCHGDNLFVGSHLLEICPSHSVNVRMAGRAVVPQGVQGCLSLCVCACVFSDIGGGICAPVRVCMSLVFSTLFYEVGGMLNTVKNSLFASDNAVI